MHICARLTARSSSVCTQDLMMPAKGTEAVTVYEVRVNSNRKRNDKRNDSQRNEFAFPMQADYN